ncbi:MAG: ATP-binding protein, partial [Deltaproteobacteria bacterium]|nr:ATP-binding protein [Deltaproteobacteria bacterium]
MAVTYPGTVSPLRGLDPYGEAERDVWQGHETERDAIAKLVTADGFRAGLLFGEPGVGKTSLVRAGLIPYLRDHGIVSLACEDLSQPSASFAAGLSAFGIQPTPGEPARDFVTRAVANAVPGQQFVFIVDDVDLLCMDERATMELSDLFSRVISRSAGKARFLFVCASERLHILGNIERRTGSLFPPSTRYELHRLQPGEASKIFDRILSFSGVAADPALATTVVQGLGHGQPVLPADLQLAGLAMRDLRISNAAALHKAGGPTELEEAWLLDACRATGNERSAMRLCAELAQGGPGPRPGDEVIRGINLDPSYGQHAFTVLEQRGVIIRGDANGTTWMLRHEVLTQRVRELTAPARAAARRAFDLLGSKTANKERLTIGELRALRSEGIAPATPAEIAVVERSKRYYLAILAVIAAIPIIITIIIWVTMRGRVYFDLTTRAGGDHVVVRGGRAGLSSFFWLPGGFGDEVADTGLTRSMVAPEQWKKIDNHDLGAGSDDWAGLWKSLMAPQLAGLVDYASGNDAAIDSLKKAAKEPEDLAELLTVLRPISRGSAPEVALVEA